MNSAGLPSYVAERSSGRKAALPQTFMPPDLLRRYLLRLIRHEDLNRDEAAGLLEGLLSGD